MKLTKTQKIRTGLALGVVFLVILATNQIDQNNFTIVQKSVTSIYQDRLLTKDYLFKISRLLDIKKVNAALYKIDPDSPENKLLNDSLTQLVQQFRSVNLVYEEEKVLDRLDERLEELYRFEQYDTTDSIAYKEGKMELIEAVLMELDNMASIQVEEGLRVKKISENALERSDMIYKLEIGALFIIALIIQLLIFVKPMK